MLEKDPGLSWIDIKSVVHVFFFPADDYSLLQIVRGNLRK